MLSVIIAIVALSFLAAIGWLCWRLWKKGPYGHVAAVAITTLIVYQIWAAVTPSPSFFNDEFAFRTGIALPLSAKIKFKKASYPDFHGDYASEILFEVSPEDFAWLERLAKANPPDRERISNGMFWQEAEAAYGQKLTPSIRAGLRMPKSDQNGGWALLSDRKTVYFWFVQT